MYLTHFMDLSTTRYYVKAGLVLLCTLSLSEFFDQVMLVLEPKKNVLDWAACLAGALVGQYKLGGKHRLRFFLGVGVGYLAGLYGGIDLAKCCNLSEVILGRFLAAALADRILTVLEYVLSNPVESADFLIEKGAKLATIFSDDVWGKALGHVKGLFTKKNALATG